ncbi:MAG: hypothetical protein ACXWUE_20610 [Polyangiales bacterium]
MLPDRLDGPLLGAMSARGDFRVIEPLFEAWLDGDQRLAVEESHVRLHPPVGRWFRRATARIDLNAQVAWSIRVEGGLRRMHADLACVPVRALDVLGSVTDSRIAIGCPSGLARVRIQRSVRRLSLARPRGVPVRLVGRESWESPGFDGAPSRLELHVGGELERLTLEEL